MDREREKGGREGGGGEMGERETDRQTETERHRQIDRDR